MNGEVVMRSTDFEINPEIGPRFFEKDGEVMFQHVVDRTSSIGPRPAKERDKIEHPGAWAAFSGEEASAAEAAPAPRRGGRRRRTP